jgi:hypothetical protein
VRNDHEAHGAMQSAAPARAAGDVAQSAMQPAIDRDTARLRAATAAFRTLDAAVAAGYSSDGGGCLSHPTQGAMGFHHNNAKLTDDRVELERPEILVYQLAPNGEYRLTGVEYFVPFLALPRTAEPPTVMGQKLKPFDEGKFWYLHAWVWLDNPSGLFADWNPTVRCS